MNNEADLKELILLLQCPHCKEQGSLELIQGAYDFKIPIELCKKFILCSSCNEHYPLTSDFIPIMWSTSLKKAFLILKSVVNELTKPLRVNKEDSLFSFAKKYQVARSTPVLANISAPRIAYNACALSETHSP